MGHHYVPQRYLRNFEVKEQPGFIWQYPKKGGEPKCVSIKKAAQARDFYEPEVEKFLDWGIERRGGDAIDQLLTGKPLSEDARQAMALYLTVMLRRTPAFRRWAMDLAANSLPDFMEALRAEVKSGQLGFSGDIEKDVAELDRIEKKYELGLPSNVIDDIRNPIPRTGVIFLAISSMSWRVFVITGPQFFITSDDPFFFTKGIGLGNPDAEMFLPLSPTHLLHGSRKESFVRIPWSDDMPQRIVRGVNSRTAFYAENFAYTHAEVSWLPPILARKEFSNFRPEWMPKRP